MVIHFTTNKFVHLFHENINVKNILTLLISVSFINNTEQPLDNSR